MCAQSCERPGSSVEKHSIKLVKNENVIAVGQERLENTKGNTSNTDVT